MSRQLRIAAVALGVVAIWWILWKVVDFEGAPASRGDPGGGDSRYETTASDPKGPTEDAKLAADARETLGSPASAISPASGAEEPPPGPRLRLFGILLDERTQRPLSDASLRHEIVPDPSSHLYIPPAAIDELSEPFGNSVHQTRSGL